MKKSKFSEEQIAYALREVESCRPPADVCRQLGVSEATLYIWKEKYAHLGISELRCATGSSSTSGASKSWCAARRTATRNAVRLGPDSAFSFYCSSFNNHPIDRADASSRDSAYRPALVRFE